MEKGIIERAIRGRNILLVTYVSKEKGRISRHVAPLDFGVAKQFRDGKERFQFFDFDSPNGPHYTAVLLDHIIDIQETEKRFEPTFITWKPPYNWEIQRDWGKYS